MSSCVSECLGTVDGIHHLKRATDNIIDRRRIRLAKASVCRRTDYALTRDRCLISAVEVVIQSRTDHCKILVFLQHKRLVTRNEVRVVGTEIVEEAFHSKAQMRSDFVLYPAANHEA